MRAKYVIPVIIGAVVTVTLYCVVFFHYCDLTGITGKGDAVYSCHR